ncbi:MAG: phosphate/phosphite/phosphonate ABC transporter substrate-binding protein [Deinococcota bacterium]|jgi:phosphonate transport system substrate-binding protein|nr:phosphate/phosphite/phosphonate ABC transporter substrate-binding protein [Deinococcota bacterium]
MFKKLIAGMLALGLLVSLAPAFAQDVPERLVLGMVPSREADRMVDSLEPIAEMMSERLGIPVETFVSTNYVGLVEAIGTGTIDIGMFGPAALVQAIDRYGARPIVGSVRRGDTTYRAQFTVREDSDIESFEDLAGRTIAFVDPGSASGYQFPYVFLLTEHGIDANTDMQAIFAGSHDAAMLAVYNGDVDVAVTFEGGQSTIEADFPDVNERVRVLGYTSGIPNDGVVVRAGISEELAQQIADALIDIASTEEGQELTDALFNVTGFAPVTSDVYDIVRETSRVFQD